MDRVIHLHDKYDKKINLYTPDQFGCEYIATYTWSNKYGLQFLDKSRSGIIRMRTNDVIIVSEKILEDISKETGHDYSSRGYYYIQ